VDQGVISNLGYIMKLMAVYNPWIENRCNNGRPKHRLFQKVAEG
jgi:hypothetical protein